MVARSFMKWTKWRKMRSHRRRGWCQTGSWKIQTRKWNRRTQRYLWFEQRTTYHLGGMFVLSVPLSSPNYGLKWAPYFCVGNFYILNCVACKRKLGRGVVNFACTRCCDYADTRFTRMEHDLIVLWDFGCLDFILGFLLPFPKWPSQILLHGMRCAVCNEKIRWGRRSLKFCKLYTCYMHRNRKLFDTSQGG